MAKPERTLRRLPIAFAVACTSSSHSTDSRAEGKRGRTRSAIGSSDTPGGLRSRPGSSSKTISWDKGPPGTPWDLPWSSRGRRPPRQAGSLCLTYLTCLTNSTSHLARLLSFLRVLSSSCFHGHVGLSLPVFVVRCDSMCHLHLCNSVLPTIVPRLCTGERCYNSMKSGLSKFPNL